MVGSRFPSIVFHTDDDSAAISIRKSHHGIRQSRRGDPEALPVKPLVFLLGGNQVGMFLEQRALLIPFGFGFHDASGLPSVPCSMRYKPVVHSLNLVTSPHLVSPPPPPPLLGRTGPRRRGARRSSVVGCLLATRTRIRLGPPPATGRDGRASRGHCLLREESGS